MCSLPGECGILSQASYPVLDKGKVLEALKIARDEEKLKVDILSLMRSIDPEILVGGCFPHFYDGPIIPFFLTCFGSPNREWLWMFMNGWYWHFHPLLTLFGCFYPIAAHCSGQNLCLGWSIHVNPSSFLGKLCFFFALAMYDNTPVVLYSTSPHMVSLAQRRSPKVKPGTFDPAPGTVVSRRKWALTWETDGNIKG